MLNTERIRLMTKLAAYEQGEGKEYMAMSQYYRRDYLALQMIKTFFCSTIAFGILLALSILYQPEEWIQRLYQEEYRDYLVELVVMYVLFVIFYQVVAWIVYSLRYQKGMKRQKQFHSRLKKVEKMYERDGHETGGRI